MRPIKCALAASALLIACSSVSFANPLFSDPLDTTTSNAYNVNVSSSDTKVTFGYDYSADMIPPSPRGNGSTLGVKLEANIASPASIEAVTLSPKDPTNLAQNLSFSGNYRFSFDLWMNSDGPFPGGGTGSTEYFSGGIGYNNTTVNSNKVSGSGVWFSATNEGGASATSTSGRDFNAYNNNGTMLTDTSIYAGGGQDNGNYATAFPGQTPPAGQGDPAVQTGTTADGSLAFKWRQVDIDVIDGVVTEYIDGNQIATITNPAVTTGNVSFGYFDFFNSVSGYNGLYTFGVVDNVSVTAVPEPASLSLLGVGSLVLLKRRRKA